MITDLQTKDTGALECWTLALTTANGCHGPGAGICGTQLVYDSSQVLGDGAITANDCNDLSVTLRNIGNLPATGIHTTLVTSTPGVLVYQPNSAYPDIAGAGSTGTDITLFRISTTPEFQCGTTISLLIVASADQGLYEMPFEIPTGQAGATHRFDNNTPLPIPDLATVESPIGVSGILGPIEKVTVLLHINHTFDSDLRMELVAPNGTTVLLCDKRGASGHNFGLSCTPDGLRTTFADSAPVSISVGTAPFVGAYKPETPLSVYSGTSGVAVNGTWRLRLTDLRPEDAGNLECWSLILSQPACIPGTGQCGADLAISKSASATTVPAGEPYAYSIEVTNVGPDVAEDVVVSDTLPLGVEVLTSATTQGSLAFTGNVLTGHLGTMPPHVTAVITLTVRGRTLGLKVNVAEVASATFDPVPDNNHTPPVPTYVLPAANLVYNSHTVLGDGAITANDCNELSVTIRNIGFTDATNVRATLVTSTPGVMVYWGDSPYPDVPQQGGTAENLAPFRLSTTPDFVCGTTITLVLVATTDQGTFVMPFDIPTGVIGATYRFDNNTPLPIPDVSTVESAIPVTGLPGPIDTVTVLLHVNHTFDSDMRMELVGPDGTIVRLIEKRGGAGNNFGLACSPDGLRTILTDSASVPIGNGTPPFIGAYKPEQPLSAFSGKSGPAVNGNWRLRLTDLREEDAGNLECWSLVFTMPACSPGLGQCGADVTITKAASDTTIPVTVPFTYSIAVTNIGPDTATDVVVSDTLPLGVDLLTSGTTQGYVTDSAGLVAANLGTLAPDQTATVTLTVRASTAGLKLNVAAVDASSYDPVPANNVTQPVPVTAIVAADLAIAKSSLPAAVPVGVDYQYSVTVTNNGPNTAEDVIVSDTLPLAVDLVSSSSTQGSVQMAGRVVTAMLGSLPASTTATLTLTVVATAPGLRENVAHVDSPTTDLSPGNNTTPPIPTNVVPAAHYVITKSVSTGEVAVGIPFDYTVVVTNLGPNLAEDVVVSDTLPLALDLVSSATTQGTLSANGNVITGDVGELLPGGSVTITLTVRTDSAGLYENVASVDSPTSDPNPIHHTSAPVPVQVLEAAHLTISKASSYTTVPVGIPYDYTIIVTNSGPDPALDVVVTDPMPTGVDVLASTSTQGTVSESGGLVTADLGTVPAGGVVTVTLSVVATSPGTKLNSARVDSATTDTDPSGHVTPPVPTDVLPVANLHVSKSAPAGPLAIGVDFQYQIVVTNNGPNTAEDVVVSDTLPLGVVFVSATTTQGSVTESAGVVVATLGDLPNGGSATITLTAHGATSGKKTNVAFVDSATTTTDPGGHRSPPVTTLIAPTAILRLTKEVSSTSVPVGVAFTYTIGVTNTGPDAADDVIVSDTLPAALDVVTSSVTQGTVAESAGLVTAALGSLASDAAATVTLTVVATDPGPIANVASVDSPTTTTDPSGNITSPVVMLITPPPPPPPPSADLVISKSAAPTPVHEGDLLTYTIAVGNLGPNTATGVTMTDPLPPQVQFVSTSSSQGTSALAGSAVVAHLGTIAVGTTATVTIVVRTRDSGTAVNTATASGNEYDPDPDGNTASIQTIIEPSCDLLILKSADPHTVHAGEPLAYAIAVYAVGPSTAENVTVSDVLPAGMTFQSGVVSQGTLSVLGNVLTADLGSLDPPNLGVINIKVTPAVDGVWVNTAKVSASTYNPQPGHEESSVTVTVLPSADIAVTKTGFPDPVRAGESLAYTITVSNNGPSTATAVTAADSLMGCARITTHTLTRGTADVYETTAAFTLGDMGPGEVTTITLGAVPSVEGLLENMVSASSPTYDPVPDNNRAIASTTVTGPHVTQILDEYFTSVTVMPPNSLEGWTVLGFNTPGFAQSYWDPTSATLVTKVAADPNRYRTTGWFANYTEWMPQTFVGTTNFVRGKYYLYASGQADPAQLNQIPNFRVRVANRFAVSSILTVDHHLNIDPPGTTVSEELRPSTDPYRPSIYRVDFAPVNVPLLVSRMNIEGIMRGFESYCMEPQENGNLSLVESTLGVYPSAALTDCRIPFKVYEPTASGPGNLGVQNPTELTAQRFIIPPGEGAFPIVDGTTQGLTYAEGPFGITMDSSSLPTTVTGVIAREFAPDATFSTILRVDESKQYKVRFHVVSTQQSNLNTLLRLRTRTLRFAWAQSYEVGGAFAAGSLTNLLAQQALPGVGCLNPDKVSNENGGWYTLLMWTPMDPDIRPEYPAGTPLSVRMPAIVAQPGPGENAPSRRDVRIGADLIDTLSTGLQRNLEKGNFTIDRIELQQYNAIPD